MTEVQQMITEQKAVQEKLTVLTDAVNGLGANIQWIIDNVQGIFQMFSSPQFMAMLPNMMGGAQNAGPGPDEGN